MTDPHPVAILLAGLASLAPAAGHRDSAPADAPSISSISPDRRDMESPGFTLTVRGTGFRQNAVVRWNGADRMTSYVSTGELRASIPASDLVARGTVAVTVSVPGGQGGLSNAATFTIVGNPVPAIGSIFPTTADAGGEPFTLTVNGSDFVVGAVVRWNDEPLTTGRVSASRLTASVPSSRIPLPRTARISVANPTPGGGASTSLDLSVVHRTPSISGLSPAQATSGGAAFTLTVTGQHFIRNGSTVRWNGAGRTTTFVSPTRLRATIPASDLADQGGASVTVTTRLSRILLERSGPASFSIERLPAQTLARQGSFLSGAGFVADLDCSRFGASFVMVGMRGRHGNAVDEIRVGCAELSAAGLSETVRWTARWDDDDQGGTAFERRCAAGSAVSGFEGSFDPFFGQLRSIRLRCRELRRFGLTTGGTARLTTFGSATSRTWGPTDCSLNRPARAVRAAKDFFKPLPLLAPTIVVGVQLICEQPTVP